MRLNKYISAVLAVFMLAFALAGCAKKRPDEQEIPDSGVKLHLLDEGGDELAALSVDSMVTAVDRGLFYACGAGSMEGADTRFRLYDPATGEDKLLGTVGKMSYEAQYARTELDGRIYTLCMTGDLMDSIPDKLWLCCFDPDGKAASYVLSEDGFPYAAMSAVGGKLLIIVHDGNTDELHDKLFEFDPASGSLEEKLFFYMGGRGESLRAVCPYRGGFALLRLCYEKGAVTEAYVDEYSLGYEKLGETNITDMMRSIAGRVISSEDTDNELAQIVSRFILTDDGYMYYENFSATRFIADINTGECIAADDLLLASLGAGEPVYFMMFGEKMQGAGDPNTLYRLRDGALYELPIKCLGDGETISYVSAAPNGSAVIGLQTGAGDTESRAYYFKDLG